MGLAFATSELQIRLADSQTGDEIGFADLVNDFY